MITDRSMTKKSEIMEKTGKKNQKNNGSLKYVIIAVIAVLAGVVGIIGYKAKNPSGSKQASESMQVPISGNDADSSTENDSAHSRKKRGVKNLDDSDYVSSAVTGEVGATDFGLPLEDRIPRYILKVYFDYGSSENSGRGSVLIERTPKPNGIDFEEQETNYESMRAGTEVLINKIPKDKKDTTLFLIEGHTDPALFNAKREISERSEKFNRELSEKRADSVRQVLEGSYFKISPTQIQVKASGYAGYEDSSEADWAECRRVDISIFYE